MIEKEGPIHISNVMLLDPKTNDPTRVTIKREDADFRIGRKEKEANRCRQRSFRSDAGRVSDRRLAITNDLKKKFYAVLLAELLLKLAQENQKTFEEIINHTTEIFKLGEISGLDLQRLEIEKFKFDTDVANSETGLRCRSARLATYAGRRLSSNEY